MSTRILCLVLLSVVTAACGSDEGPRATSTPEPSPASVEAIDTASPTPSPVATATPSPSCPNEDEVAANPITREPGGLSGDVTGDGYTDRVYIDIDPDGRRGCYAFVEVSSQMAHYLAPIDDRDIPFERGLPALHSLVNVDDRPGLEVVVDITAGASTEFAGLFTMEGADLARIRVRGDPALEDGLFGYGGSVGHVDAVDCASDGNVVASSAEPKGRSYEVVRHFFSPQGAFLVAQPSLSERRRMSFARLNQFPEFPGSPFSSCA